MICDMCDSNVDLCRTYGTERAVHLCASCIDRIVNAFLAMDKGVSL